MIGPKPGAWTKVQMGELIGADPPYGVRLTFVDPAVMNEVGTESWFERIPPGEWTVFWGAESGDLQSLKVPGMVGMFTDYDYTPEELAQPVWVDYRYCYSHMRDLFAT